MADRNPASAFSAQLLVEFARAGVRHVVLSPGSRSQALALAAAELEHPERFQLHVRIDERSACFLALGLALESHAPTVVITTSGTAAANLHPAILEAHHAGVPLIVVTADRPVELRGIRSNQTTVQAGLFRGSVRQERDVAAPVGHPDERALAADLARHAVLAATGCDETGEFIPEPGPGPVHLNLAFRDPLSGPAGEPLIGGDEASSPPSEARVPIPHVVQPAPGTIVVAGADAGPEAEEFAHLAGLPLIAEITSGARFGRNLVVPYRELLRDPDLAGEVCRVIVFGTPTLSREVPALVSRDDVHTIAVARSGTEWFNPSRRVRQFERAVTVPPDYSPGEAERAWLGRWLLRARALLNESVPPANTDPLAAPAAADDYTGRREHAKAVLASVREPVTRTGLARAVWDATWPHDRLIFGASRLIRDADGVVPGKRIPVFANRGLAGIDGTVATALGIALASQSTAKGSAGVTRAVIGDLTLLHDSGSLLVGAGEPRPRIQLIVGNDGGGSIFDQLEVAATAPPDKFRRVLFTPHTVDIAALAAAYSWDYRRAETMGELTSALASPVSGSMLIEVPLPRL